MSIPSLAVITSSSGRTGRALFRSVTVAAPLRRAMPQSPRSGATPSPSRNGPAPERVPPPHGLTNSGAGGHVQMAPADHRCSLP